MICKFVKTVGVACAVSASVLMGSISLQAQELNAPGMSIAQADPISPSSALSYYNGANQCTYFDVISTCSIQKSAIDLRVIEQARALRNDPDAIFEYVYNTVDLTPLFGLQKGGVGALLDNTGTAFDQAQLMIDMLRADNPDTSVVEETSARYALGILNLSSSEFKDVYGTNDARMACKMLADGGIPALVNGSTNCPTLSGSIQSVSLLHVWVEAQIDGSWWSFDPSSKTHDEQQGQNVSSLGGINLQQFLSRAKSGMQSGNTAAGAWISDLNSDNIETDLTSGAKAFLANVNSQNIQGPMEVLIGGRSIAPLSNQPVRSHTVPYQDSLNITWAEIPDLYRTKLTVQALEISDVGGVKSYGIDKGFYVDEVYGVRMTLRYERYGFGDYGQPQSGYAPLGTLKGNLVLFVGHTAISEIDEMLYSGAIPYRNAEYNVGDIVSGGFDGNYDVVLTVDHSYATASGEYADRSSHKKASTDTYPEIIFSIGGTSFDHVDAYERAAAHHQSRYDYYMGEFCRQVVNNDSGTAIIEEVCGDEPMAEYGMGNEGGAFHLTELRRDSDFAWRRWAAKSNTIADHISRLENGSIVSHHSIGLVGALLNEDTRTVLDVDSSVSVNLQSDNASRRAAMFRTLATFASRFEGEKTVPTSMLTSNEVAGDRLYLIDNADLSSLSLSGYSTDLLDAVSDAVTDGFEVLMPEKQGVCANLDWHQSYHEFASYQTNSVCETTQEWFVRVKPDGSFVGSMSKINGEFRKGGVSSGGENTGLRGNPDLQTRDLAFGAGGVSKNVDVSTGDLTFSLPSDISDGSVKFPYGFEFQRSYRSGSSANLPIGFGWTHNYDQFLTISSSDNQLLGISSLKTAVPTVLALMTALDVAENGNAPEDWLIMSAISEWLWIGTKDNLATVNSGEGGGQFSLLVDGTYDAGPLNTSSLSYDINNSGFHPDLGTFYLASQAGDLRKYELLTPSEQGIVRSDRNTRYLTSWEFPKGIDVSLDYRSTTGTLETISNSLGRTLDFDYVNSLSCIHTVGAPTSYSFLCNERVATWNRLQSVKNSADQTLKLFLGDSSPGGGHNFVLAGGVRHSYHGLGNTDKIMGTTYSGAKLTKIFPYGETQNPYFEVSYGQNRGLLPNRVHTLKDTKGNEWEYFVSGRRSSIVDPEGAETIYVFDNDSRLVSETSAVGETTTTTYDAIGRVASVTYPEDNKVEYEYDSWNNVVKTTNTAKPNSGYAPQVMESSYKDISYTHASGQTVTINVLDYTLDAQQRRTDYTYHSNGTLMQVKSPCLNNAASCSDSARAITNYAYYPSGLLHTVTNPESTVTEYAYDSSGNLSSAIVDPTGKALKTVYSYDQVGNMCREIGPRGSAGLTGGYDSSCD